MRGFVGAGLPERRSARFKGCRRSPCSGAEPAGSLRPKRAALNVTRAPARSPHLEAARCAAPYQKGSGNAQQRRRPYTIPASARAIDWTRTRKRQRKRLPSRAGQNTPHRHQLCRKRDAEQASGPATGRPKLTRRTCAAREIPPYNLRVFARGTAMALTDFVVSAHAEVDYSIVVKADDGKERIILHRNPPCTAR